MISIIIPAKDEEKYIGECLQSILDQHMQEPPEIIVVDNASTDATAYVAGKFPGVRVVHEPVPGTNQARQRGFRTSQGDVLMFFDADVRLPHGWIDAAIKKLNMRTDLVAFSAPYSFYDFPLLEITNQIFNYLIARPFCFIFIRSLRVVAQMSGGVMVIRRNVLEQIGWFDTNRKFYGDDTGTAMKLKKVGYVAYDFGSWVHSSGRRYLKKGLLKTISIYMFNLFYIWFRGEPYHEDEEIVR